MVIFQAFRGIDLQKNVFFAKTAENVPLPGIQPEGKQFFQLSGGNHPQGFQKSGGQGEGGFVPVKAGSAEDLGRFQGEDGIDRFVGSADHAPIQVGHEAAVGRRP